MLDLSNPSSGGSKMQPTLQGHLERISAVVADKRYDFSERFLTVFYPLRGCNYSGQIMIVGRAVNGWTYERWRVRDPGQDKERADVMKEAMMYDSAHACAMGAVVDHWKKPNDGGYRFGRSPFWRVVGQLVDDLNITEKKTPNCLSHIVWTNLYKVAPWCGGNPSERLKKVQREGCIEMLKTEIEINQPKRLLFLTGLDWAEPFLQGLAPEYPFAQSLEVVQVRACLKLLGTEEVAVVVAKYPERKRGRTEREIVDGISAAFRHLGT